MDDSKIAPAAADLDTKRQSFFISPNRALLHATAEDDLLHPAANAETDDDSVAETQFFSVNVAAEKIHGLGYLWHHPKIGAVTGGVWIWQGTKRLTQSCEMFDIRGFMHDRVLANDLHEYRLENGYGVKVLEPLKRHHVTYADPARQNSLDLVYEALRPPVMFGDARHFEQPMRARGELVLRGRRYDVDCRTVRDRSWGKPRPESNIALPPTSWTTGVFSDDFIFSCNAFDDPARDPMWGSKFTLPADRVLNGGWIDRDGHLAPLVRCSKRTEHDPVTMFPRSIEMDFTDAADRSLSIKGEMVAASDWSTWPNLRFVDSLMRWECEGQVAYGDCQEAHWTDYLNAFPAS